MKCPGCNETSRTQITDWRATCPNCGEVINYVKCEKSGWYGPLLSRWKNYTHPGCRGSHPNPGYVAPTDALSLLHDKTEAAIRRDLASGEKVQYVHLGMSRKMGVVVTDHRVIIYKSGIQTGSWFSTMHNSWTFRQIAGVELRTAPLNEVLVIQAAGVLPVTKYGQFDKGSGSAWEAPNAIHLGGNRDTAQKLVQVIRSMIR